jgi:hypothetical protein
MAINYLRFTQKWMGGTYLLLGAKGRFAGATTWLARLFHH